MFVNKGDSHGPLANGGGAPLDRTMAHIPCRKEAWNARL